jgi:hypothetical protein
MSIEIIWINERWHYTQGLFIKLQFRLSKVLKFYGGELWD